MNSVKTKIVINWLTLVNVKDVQSFLNFANFYRRFVYEFSNIADSLINLIKKKTKFLWIDKCQIAFEILKKTFIFDVILKHFDFDRFIIVEIDVFDYISSDILF
jgi:hypothetical protein